MRRGTFRTHDRRTIQRIYEVEALLRARSNERRNWQSNTMQAIQVVQNMDRHKALAYLQSLIEVPEFGTKYGDDWVITALGYSGDARASDVLYDWLARSNNGCSGKVVEALGRLADARSLPILELDDSKQPLYAGFRTMYLLSWAFASIAAQTTDLATRRQAAIQLLNKFDHFIYDIGLHQMPWFESDMLGYVETLLSDADQHVRLNAAWFLALHGNPIGADLLLAYLALPEHSEIGALERECIDALITINDRRSVSLILDWLARPDMPHYLVESLYLADCLHLILEQWGDTLTDRERDHFTQAVPKILAHLPQGYDLTGHFRILKAIQLIKTVQANALLDEWLTIQLAPLFQPYLDAGINGVNAAFFASLQRVIISGFFAKANILAYPFVGQYAFQILRERYEMLRTEDEKHVELDWTIAHIGWLGDRQALPFLQATFDRLISQMPSSFAWNDWHWYQAAEIFYAIVNLGMIESIPFFAAWVPQLRHINTSYEALRDLVLSVPDQRIIEALLTHFAAHEEYGSYEIIHAIGLTGSVYGVSGLLRLIAQRAEPTEQTHELGEVITALARIAKANLTDTELIDTIVSALKPLLAEKQILDLSTLFHPVETMPVDFHTALALQLIGTPEALSLIEEWRLQNKQKSEEQAEVDR